MEAVRKAAPEWSEKFKIERQHSEQYYMLLKVHFSLFNVDPAQWELVEADVESLPIDTSSFDTGSWELNPEFGWSTPQPHGESLVYSPVPVEMLRTHHNKPQVIGTVDGLPVACSRVDCDFTYVEPLGLITAFSVQPYEEGYLATITGTDLPATWHSIRLANSSCFNSPAHVNTATHIFCSFND